MIFLISPITIALMFILKTILIIIGWPLVWLAVKFKAYESYLGKDGAGTPRTQYRFTWRIMWLWGNDEDGIANDDYKKLDTIGEQIIYWYNRNPVNNLRFVPILSCKIVPEKVRWIGSLPKEAKPEEYSLKNPLWVFSWCGIYSNLLILFFSKGELKKFRIGWKIAPKDVYGVTGFRANNAGFAIQIRPA